MKLSPTLRFYIKQALITAVLYGILSIVMDLVRGEALDVNAILFSSLFFGLFFGLFMVVSQAEVIRSMSGQPLSDDDLKTVQRRSIESAFSPKEVVEKINQANLFKNRNAKLASDKILLNTKMTWSSWGEFITITWTETGSLYHYEVESRPYLKSSVIDGGRNFANVENILAVIHGEKGRILA